MCFARFRSTTLSMENGENRKNGNSETTICNRLPPAGTAIVDNQGNSDACVRFAIAKAVANQLYVKKRIDVDQGHIMNCLVQIKRSICPINPKEYNDITLYLQDIDHGRGQNIPKKSWWEVIHKNLIVPPT